LLTMVINVNRNENPARRNSRAQPQDTSRLIAEALSAAFYRISGQRRVRPLHERFLLRYSHLLALFEGTFVGVASDSWIRI
jgi:hypothetical protein